MNWIPPWIVRRALVDPLAVALGIVAVVLLPPVLLVCALIDLTLRRPFPTTRLVAVAFAHVIFDAFGVVCLFGLWVASVFGSRMRSPWMQGIHHRFVRWWLGALLGTTTWLLRIRVLIEERQPPRPGPVLVFSRHAGPWDSFLLAYTLVDGFRRRPRIVMKAALQWFPFLDIVGNRLPNRFIQPGSAHSYRFIGEIEELARDMGDRDALVIFPEGGNFTEKRRIASIGKLFDIGQVERAKAAHQLANLIAPRPGGVRAALRGAPDAEPVFVAHTGLETLSSLRALWRSVPLQQPLTARYWRVPRGDVPADEDDVVDWLYAWWERIDAWIDDHRGSESMRRATRA